MRYGITGELLLKEFSRLPHYCIARKTRFLLSPAAYFYYYRKLFSLVITIGLEDCMAVASND